MIQTRSLTLAKVTAFMEVEDKGLVVVLAPSTDLLHKAREEILGRFGPNAFRINNNTITHISGSRCRFSIATETNLVGVRADIIWIDGNISPELWKTATMCIRSPLDSLFLETPHD